MDSDLMYSLGMANSAIQFAGAQIGAVDDKKWIDKQNEKSREFQLQMWNKANEYNLPENAVERLRNAGLNPALMYSNGPGSLMAETVSAPGHSAPNMGSAQNANQRGIAMAQLAMQRELQDSNIAVNESVITKNIAEANQAENLGEKYGLENYVSRETLKTQIDSTIETYNQLLKSGKIQDEKLQQEIQKKLQELERTSQELEHTKQEKEVTNQAINETARTAEAVETQKAQTSALKASANASNAAAEASRADASLKRALAKTESWRRQEIAQNIKQSKEFVKQIQSVTGLNKKQAEKLNYDIAIALAKGDLDWISTNVTNRYTGAAAILNPIVDAYSGYKGRPPFGFTGRVQEYYKNLKK